MWVGSHELPCHTIRSWPPVNIALNVNDSQACNDKPDQLHRNFKPRATTEYRLSSGHMLRILHVSP